MVPQESHRLSRDRMPKLQSTGQELEVSKEELQSLYERLRTVGRPLRQIRVREATAGLGEPPEGVPATWAEQKAEAARAHAEAIVATVREPLVVLTPELRVRSANPAFYRTFGLQPGVTEGRSLFELEGGRWDDSRLGELLGEVLARGRAVEDLEVGAEIEGLGRRTLRLNAQRVEGYELVLLAIEDVTGSKHYEDALRQALARAEQEAGSRERFLAALSHELRNLLSPALATVSKLRGEAAMGSGSRDGLARVERNLQDEARLIDGLLDLERIECGRLDLHPQEVDVIALVARAAEILTSEGLAAAGLTLEMEQPRIPELAWADPDRLAQVFRNLLGNAVKFTPAGGSITVRSGRADDGSLQVEVTDTGAGIAAEDLPVLFARFGITRAAARDARAGLGLGLSISRAIVDGLGGELTAASAGAGQGSTFTVRLPPVAAGRERGRAETLRGTVEPPEAPRLRWRPLPAHGPLRLLLIEDHQGSREALAELLEAMGHEVVTASLVSEALAVAAQRCAGGGSGIDLVICDNGLPDGTGVALMRELADRYHLPGIALTGRGMGSDVSASFEAGFAVHLTKPVDVGRLREAIESLRAKS